MIASIFFTLFKTPAHYAGFAEAFRVIVASMTSPATMSHFKNRARDDSHVVGDAERVEKPGIAGSGSTARVSQDFHRSVLRDSRPRFGQGLPESWAGLPF